MARITVAKAGNAAISIEWNDNNLRVNRAYIINNEPHDIAVSLTDDEGQVLYRQTYAPGIHQQNLPGSARRFVDILQIVTGDIDISLNGISIGLRNPA